MKFNVTIQNDIKFDLEMYSKQFIDDVKFLLEEVIINTEIQATRSAPSFVSIDKRFSNNGLTGEVGILGNQLVASDKGDPSNLAVYIEFGTGLSAKEILADYPEWIKELAMQYYVNGRGTLIGSPYLFNNFLTYISIFERKLELLIKKTKKQNLGNK